MKYILAFSLIVIGYIQFVTAHVPKSDTTKNLSKFMKPAIAAKDAPATCWFLGQIQGYAIALKNSGDPKAGKLLEVAKDGAGKCGGKNSLNLTETFTPEEWSRLSDLQKKLEILVL
ncbi:hypothetical protein D3C87_1299940 [compost metagenome]